MHKYPQVRCIWNPRNSNSKIYCIFSPHFHPVSSTLPYLLSREIFQFFPFILVSKLWFNKSICYFCIYYCVFGYNLDSIWLCSCFNPLLCVLLWTKLKHFLVSTLSLLSQMTTSCLWITNLIFPLASIQLHHPEYTFN